jgi:hypothetical protein
MVLDPLDDSYQTEFIQNTQVQDLEETLKE